ncbi:MAG: hypothetical protein EBY16_03820 [Gammaproteobacteria bacterium]|nr:hypothetical protein [Gammaproteobacteria bacterium]
MNHSKLDGLKTKTEYLVLVFLSLISFVLIAVIAHYSNRGFDLSDEGFYINSIVFPQLYTENFTLFGFFYHPLFLLTHKNWILFRQVNLLVIFTLSAILSSCCLKFIVGQNQMKKTNLTVLSLSLAIFVSTYLTSFNWLISPSYNSLNFIGILIVSIGMVIRGQTQLSKQIQLMIMAFGFFCIFMSKISSLLVFGWMFVIYCLSSRHFSFQHLCQMAIYFAMLVFMAIYLIDGDILVFTHRMLEGVKAYRLFITPSVWRIDLFHPLSTDKNTLWVITLFLTSYLTYFSIEDNEKKKILLCFFAFLLGIKTLGFMISFDLKKAFRLQEIDLFYLPIIVFLNVAFSAIINQRNLMQKNKMLLGLYFFLLPYAYSFGTSNPYWFQAQMLGFFWILSAFLFLSPLLSNRNTLLLVSSPMLCFGLFLLAICDYRALRQPYRQANIMQHQLTPMQMPNQAQVFVSKELADCISGLKAKIDRQILQKPYNLIDFTGFSPGLMYLIDANPVASPWFLVDYPNSDKYFYQVLSPILKMHRQANYLLLAGDGKKIKQKFILKKLNINLLRNYEEVVNQSCDLQAYGPGQVSYHIYRPKSLA